MHRFEKQKASELKKMMIAFAKIHLQFCEKVNGGNRADIHAFNSLSLSLSLSLLEHDIMATNTTTGGNDGYL
jgi:hypothetical protein